MLILDELVKLEQFENIIKTALKNGASLKEVKIGLYLEKDSGCLHSGEFCFDAEGDTKEVSYTLETILRKKHNLCKACYSYRSEFHNISLKIHNFNTALSMKRNLVKNLENDSLTPHDGLKYFKMLADLVYSYSDVGYLGYNFKTWVDEITKEIFSAYYLNFRDKILAEIANAYFYDNSITDSEVINTFSRTVSESFTGKEILVHYPNILNIQFYNFYVKQQKPHFHMTSDLRGTGEQQISHIFYQLLQKKILHTYNPTASETKVFVAPAAFAAFLKVVYESVNLNAKGYTKWNTSEIVSLEKPCSSEQLETINTLYKGVEPRDLTLEEVESHMYNLQECVNVSENLL